MIAPITIEMRCEDCGKLLDTYHVYAEYKHMERDYNKKKGIHKSNGDCNDNRIGSKG